MNAKKIHEKIGGKQDMRAIFIKAPVNVIELIDSPRLEVKTRLSGKFDYIHLFVKNEEEFHNQFPKLKSFLDQKGMLWVSWPKNGQEDTDLNIKRVIKLGYDYGLVESKAISIDEVWSGLKFTWPRDKVEYKNSYGKLKKK